LSNAINATKYIYLVKLLGNGILIKLRDHEKNNGKEYDSRPISIAFICDIFEGLGPAATRGLSFDDVNAIRTISNNVAL
jgi:hypothetical protein